MTELNSDQYRSLLYAPDTDMLLSDARRLSKAAQPNSESSRRKRVAGNVFSTLSGRSQPRQGFLSLEVLRAIYSRSELVRAIIDLLIEIVVSTDWTIKPIDEDKTKYLKDRKPEEYLDQQRRINWLKKFFQRPNGYEDLETFHRKLLRDLLIFDAAAYEIVTARYGNGFEVPLEIGVVAGDTIEIECDESGIPIAYTQSYNVNRRIEYEEGELAYLQLYPSSWTPYGSSPIENAYVSIASDLSANKLNMDYFSRNGITPGLLAVLGVSQAEFRSIMSQLRSTNADNPHNIHAFRAQRNPDGSAQKTFDYVPLTQATNREMQFQELLEFVARRVCMAYKVTPSQIGLTGDMAGGIGNGIADQQQDAFNNAAIAPLLRKITATHNHYIIHELLGWDDLTWSWEQTGTPQEESAYQKSVQEVQLGAKTINEHRQEYGSRKPLDWGDAPTSPLPGYQQQPGPGDLQQQAAGMMGGMGGGAPQQPSSEPPQPPRPPNVNPMQKSAEKRIIITF